LFSEQVVQKSNKELLIVLRIIALAKNHEEQVRRATSQVEHVAVLILTVPFDHKTGSTLGTGTYTQVNKQYAQPICD
jgi:hypothetical protein